MMNMNITNTKYLQISDEVPEFLIYLIILLWIQNIMVMAMMVEDDDDDNDDDDDDDVQIHT